MDSILIRCISSVLKSNYPNIDVVFFDNGSTDGSVEFVRKEFPSETRLRIIAIPDNYGPAAGFNKALEHTRGKYVVILNNDVEVESESVRELVKIMEDNPGIGIAHSKILSFDRIHIQGVGLALDPSLTAHSIGNTEEDKGQYNSVSEATAPSAACMILRRSMIEKTGLFDPNYFLYHDDVDLGLRARLSGFKVTYVPSSVVYHKGATTISNNASTMYHALISRVGLFIKNLEFRSMVKLWVPVFMRIILGAYDFLKKGEAIFALRSISWVLSNFRNDWKLRQIVQKRIRKVSDDELFEYFLDNSTFILHLKRTFLLGWTGRPQDNRFESVKPFLDVYYRDHRVSAH